MTTEITKRPATALLALPAMKPTAVFDAVVDYIGDRVALDQALESIGLSSRIAKLTNAHSWGVENPALGSERNESGKFADVAENENRLHRFARSAESRYRKLARVPTGRLRQWISAQAANPDTAAVKIIDFEKSHWYRTEDWKEELAAHYDEHHDLDLDDYRAWGVAHTERQYLVALVGLMDDAVEEGEAVRKARRKADEAVRWAAAKRDAEDNPVDSGAIRVCSCLDMAQHVEAGSLDAIFTDPPYPVEYLPCWDELASFALHALRPGGLLLAMSGQMFLPSVIDKLCVPGLRYRWLVSHGYVRPIGNIHAAKVSVGWKPLLAFTREGGHPQHYSEDAFKSEALTAVADKKDHEWGQNVADCTTIALEWLRPGWKVCDPFVGAGALLVGAKAAGCEVSGCDIDAAHVATARSKLT